MIGFTDVLNGLCPHGFGHSHDAFYEAFGDKNK